MAVGILDLVSVLVLAGLSLYLFIVFPVAVVVSLVNAPNLSKSAKAIWVVACVIGAPITTWVYCFVTRQSVLWRVTSVAGMITLAVLLFFASSYL